MKIIHYSLIAILAAGSALTAHAQGARGGQEAARGQGQNQNRQICIEGCDGERVQLRDGSGQGRRSGERQLNSQRLRSGQEAARGQRQNQNRLICIEDCDGERMQLRDGSGQGRRSGERQLDGQRRGPQDGSGKRHGGGLRDGSGPCGDSETCPNTAR